MKHLLLASTVLALVGTIGTAHAVPIVSNTVEIWNGPNPAPGDQGNPTQQGLPSTAEGGTNPLPLLLAQQTYMQPINYNLQGPAQGASSMVGEFFTVGGNGGTGAPLPPNCGTNCSGATLSANGFTTGTLFEFEFTTTVAGTLAVTHDDGISLFVQNDTTNNLIPNAFAPTNSHTDTSGLLAPGTYDLWYAAVNGDPEILITNFTPAVVSAAEPTSLALLGSALGGLGWLGRRRNAV